MDQRQKQKQAFIHLFERVGEPLYFGPRGQGDVQLLYNIDARTIACPELEHASSVNRSAFSSGMEAINVRGPSQMPDLTSISQQCSRTSLFCYFNPQHREAAWRLRELLMRENTLEGLLSLACACRDSPMVNCKLWINAFTSCLIHNPQTRTLPIPAVWEIMPDMFFGAFTIRQALRQAELPQQDRNMVILDQTQTGRVSNPENRLAYWREDIGLNSHHWHWHLIYPPNARRVEGGRKGELFYYMHHQMIARYDCERLANNMGRVRPLSIDDNPVIKDGYFGKLTDANSGQTWGTRQDNTPLVSINRPDDSALAGTGYEKLSIEDLRKYRDRLMEAIDTGMVKGPKGEKIPLNIDILGDICEASDLSPNPQYYGKEGFHNIGHMLIAHSHDPLHKHLENGQIMMETTVNLRDPVFHQWHKYVDVIFDKYKQSLPPYQYENQGDFPLTWKNIKVADISVQSTKFGSKPNELRTFFMQSHADLSRGLDFTRSDVNKLGPIWLRFSHLNHDPFEYTIAVLNENRTDVRATVRIYMAPRLTEHGEQFLLTQQRKLFIEMDKFVETLRPGRTTFKRKSKDSSLVIPWEQTFRDLERSVQEPSPEQSICGCGWPSHLLLPRGNSGGQLYDLVVFLTNADEDAVRGSEQTENEQRQNCRESLSFCGRLGKAYPDKKPMNYPFDRKPFEIPNPSNSSGRPIPVRNINEYVKYVPNMSTVQVRIVHDASKVEVRDDGGPKGNTMRVVTGDPNANSTTLMCPAGGTNRRGSGGSSSRPGSLSIDDEHFVPGGSPTNDRRPMWNQSRPSVGQGSHQRPIQWGNESNAWNQRQGSPQPSPPSPGWTNVGRPGSPWGWSG